jgi:hypothetical protein
MMTVAVTGSVGGLSHQGSQQRNGTCGASCGVHMAAVPGSAIYAVSSVVGEVARVAPAGDGVARRNGLNSCPAH